MNNTIDFILPFLVYNEHNEQKWNGCNTMQKYISFNSYFNKEQNHIENSMNLV